MNQRQATVQAILNTLETRGFEYELNGETPVSDVLTDADKKTIRDTLFTQFRDGDITVSESFAETKLNDDSELKKYISGLVNNWIRKAKEFNNGQAYVTKNPGSRAHSSDEQMRELKKLYTQVKAAGDTDAIAEVEAAIEKRKSEIKPKSAFKPINVDALPEHLRSLVPSQD